MWVHDIVSIITALSTEQRRLPIGLVGTGRLGKAALFAAALDSRIAAVRVRLPSLSYRDEAEQGLLADIPRILATLDLPRWPSSCCREEAGSNSRAPYGRANPIRIWACPHSEGLFRAEPASATDWSAVANWFSDRLKESVPQAQNSDHTNAYSRDGLHVLRRAGLVGDIRETVRK